MPYDPEDADQQQRSLVDLTSGYGNQVANFAPRFVEAGYDVALSCFFGLEGGVLNWNGLPCYPTDQSRFNSVLIGEYARHHGGGDELNVTVFTLQDVWTMLGPAFEEFNNRLRWVCWTPVDHDPAPPLVVKFLKDADARVIAMSRHGQKAFAKEGIDALYVPHGIDGKVFKPEPGLKADYRKQLSIPEDAYVVGMVANNQGLPSRKCFPQVFLAFSRFAKKHKDAILYIHADVYGRNHGVNLIRLARACGIEPERMRTSDQLSLHLGIPQHIMGGVFNSFDVLCMPSMGEGFGIPLVEAQACGVPVITTDWTAMTELCGAGWLVDGDPWWDETQAAFQKLPRIDEIHDALEASYKHGEGLKARAAEFGATFDADLLMEQWIPILEEVTAPREVPALRLAA